MCIYHDVRKNMGPFTQESRKIGPFIYFLLKKGGQSYTWQRWKRGLFGTHNRTMPYIGSYYIGMFSWWKTDDWVQDWFESSLMHMSEAMFSHVEAYKLIQKNNMWRYPGTFQNLEAHPPRGTKRKRDVELWQNKRLIQVYKYIHQNRKLHKWNI